MTNAEMLARLEKLSTRALKRNAKAVKETEGHWKGLAAGKLDEKPASSFCAMHCFNCKPCALRVVTEDEIVCAVWYTIHCIAASRKLKHPLRSKPVRAAAKKMLAHVRRVGRLVGKVLEGRTG